MDIEGFWISAAIGYWVSTGHMNCVYVSVPVITLARPLQIQSFVAFPLPWVRRPNPANRLSWENVPTSAVLGRNPFAMKACLAMMIELNSSTHAFGQFVTCKIQSKMHRTARFLQLGQRGAVNCLMPSYQFGFSDAARTSL